MNPPPLIQRHMDEADAVREAETFLEGIIDPLRAVEPLLSLDRGNDPHGGGTIRLWRKGRLIALVTIVRDDRNFSVLVCQAFTEPVPPFIET